LGRFSAILSSSVLDNWGWSEHGDTGERNDEKDGFAFLIPRRFVVLESPDFAQSQVVEKPDSHP
jgi:hypothetical protein